MGYSLNNNNCGCNIPNSSSGNNDTNVCFGAVEIYTGTSSGGTVTVKNIAALPNIGDRNVAYIVEEENKIYRWDSVKAKYFVVGSDYNEIKLIDGGNSETTIYGG